MQSHIEDERAGEAGQQWEVESRFRLRGVFVAGNQADRGGFIAMRQGKAGVFSGGRRGCNARNDFEFDAMSRQSLGFFAAAAENVRVPAFQTNDGFPFQGFFNQLFVDLFLLQSPAAGAVGAGGSLSLSPGVTEEQGIDESIVEDEIGFLQTAEPLQRDEAGITGAAPYQINFSRSGWHEISVSLNC